MKRIISIFLLLLLSLMASALSFADASKEAEVLSTLNLVKGDGDGYNLGGQLKRSEAATFIVKLIGKESYVMSNKNEYSNTLFADVDDEAWYAPFVGYCHDQGIVSGFNDGTYRPEAYVSEKAFLTMVLQSMGYEADVDFNWDTVISKAYSVGLSDNIQDAVRVNDNTSYIRGDVVRVMYLALMQNINKENRTVVERLIDEKVTNKYVANKFNLIVMDKLLTEIESVQLTNESTIKVKLNEVVEELYDTDIEVKIGTENATIVDVVHKSDVLEIKVEEELYDDNHYSILIEDVVDLDKNKVKQLEKSFVGMVNKVIESDGFLISYIEPVADQLVEVFFTQEVSDEILSPLMFKYEVQSQGFVDGSYKNMSIARIEGSSNGVLIKFNNFTMSENFDYKLFVRGDLKDQYGRYLNLGNGDTYAFKGKSNSLSPFEVDDVDVVDENYILVEFSRNVDVISALEKGNYRITDLERNIDFNALDVKLYQSNDEIILNSVMVKFNKIIEDREYKIEIDDVLDTYKEKRIASYEESFFESSIDETIPEINEINVLDRGLIELVFSMPMAEKSTNGYIKISNDVEVDEIYWNSSEAEKLLLYLSKSELLDEDEDYTLQIKRNVEDYLGREVSDEVLEFDGTDDVRRKIDIESAEYLSENTVLIKFTDIVRQNDVENLSNYEFEYRNGALKKFFYPVAVSVVNDREVLLELEASYGDGDLRVTLEKVYDYSGQYRYENISESIKN